MLNKYGVRTSLSKIKQSVLYKQGVIEDLLLLANTVSHISTEYYSGSVTGIGKTLVTDSGAYLNMQDKLKTRCSRSCSWDHNPGITYRAASNPKSQ